MQMRMAAFVDLNLGAEGNVGKHDFKYGSGSCRLQAELRSRSDPKAVISADWRFKMMIGRTGVYFSALANSPPPWPTAPVVASSPAGRFSGFGARTIWVCSALQLRRVSCRAEAGAPRRRMMRVWVS